MNGSGARIALAQVNPTVGAIDANVNLVASFIARARDAGADLVVFGEQVVGGYPAEDLYLRRDFLAANARALHGLAAEARGIAVVLGFAEPRDVDEARAAPDAPAPRLAHNALALLRGGKIEAIYRKQRLPNYGVFDERRYFEPGDKTVVIDVAGVRVGLTVCEDVWEPGGPARDAAAAGAQLIVAPSGSPYHRGKRADREAMFARRAEETGTAFAFCNLVGGQDDLVFDGASFVMDRSGRVLARAAQFEEELLAVVLDSGAAVADPMPDVAEVYAALVTGLRDYIAKNGFPGVIVGISGGIDSALVALLAADALGPERLTGVVMPSPHSSDETQADARAFVENLGAELVETPIAEAMRAYEEALRPALDGPPRGVTAENIQARIRGNLLMALANTTGRLVLTTGNKSEVSVGYATLYGDMAGGFAPIKDVPKTLVYELTRFANDRRGGPAPAAIIDRPPSAELRPDQVDEDSLPPYEVLDGILAAYVEGDRSPEEIEAQGFDRAVIDEVLHLVNRAEFKRRQAAPGIRITPKAFGRDRRLPITNRFSG